MREGKQIEKTHEVEDEIAELHKKIDEKNAALYQIKQKSIIRQSIFSNQYVPTLLRPSVMTSKSQGQIAAPSRKKGGDSKLGNNKAYCALI